MDKLISFVWSGAEQHGNAILLTAIFIACRCVMGEQTQLFAPPKFLTFGRRWNQLLDQQSKKKQVNSKSEQASIHWVERA